MSPLTYLWNVEDGEEIADLLEEVHGEFAHDALAAAEHDEREPLELVQRHLVGGALLLLASRHRVTVAL